jgi:hypothetical protein
MGWFEPTAAKTPPGTKSDDISISECPKGDFSGCLDLRGSFINTDRDTAVELRRETMLL